MNIPRPEYPRPDFMRKDWINLNGEWDFTIDNSASGEEKKIYLNEFDKKITLPFCPESELSGIGIKDFMNSVWYKREVEIPSSWDKKRVIFNIGACDYHTVVYVNGEYVGDHFGGYSSFFFDITDYIKDDKATIAVGAYDDVRNGKQPRGKQSNKFESFGCLYTRTTGIWQTVWLEAVNPAYIKSAKYFTDTEAPSVTVQLVPSAESLGATATVTAYYDGKEVGSGSTTVSAMTSTISVALSEKHLWELGKGGLYDLKLTLTEKGELLDEVDSYFGLRTALLKDKKFLLNGKSVFGRFILDQGFYPDGIYTAKDEETLVADIKYSMSLGFNGARLHQKVFEPRFLYWCDKLGYMVWGEYASWGTQFSDMTAVGHFANEFLETVERDFNHPAIIGWCPLNEVWNWEFNPLCTEAIRRIFELTVKADPTRIVIDSSGGARTAGYIYDGHDYEQSPEKFKEKVMSYFNPDAPCAFPNEWKIGKPKKDDAVFVSEYGGIGWATENGWGYGAGPESIDEFYERYKGLTDVLLDCPYCFAFCYTQLTDVEQEKNGLLTYDRKMKFDVKRIREINTRKAAIED